MVADIAKATSLGIGVGPGESKYCLIMDFLWSRLSKAHVASRPLSLLWELTFHGGAHKKAWTSMVKRPRRSAVLMLCTSSWSIPRSPVAQNLRKTSIWNAPGCQRGDLGPIVSRQIKLEIGGSRSYFSRCAI